MNKFLVVIAGPTASGKTSLAIQLAQHFKSEILSCDSRQFYKGLVIGTAAPGPEQLKQVRHHFVGHLPITDTYNVYRYEQDVIRFLKTYFNDHDIAFMAGGSGLYIDAVCKGIDELPDPDPELRESLKKALKEEGLDVLREKLKTLDPEYYSKVDLMNPNRIMRAIEVSLMSGRPFSELRKQSVKTRDFCIIKIALDVPKDLLIERINQRIGNMLEEGLIEEVKSFLPYRNCNALNTVGYKEILAFLDGKLSLEEAVEKIRTNTRRYAKRQLTWFRKDKDYHWFDPEDPRAIISFISKQQLIPGKKR